MEIKKFNENSNNIGIYAIVTIPEDKRQINLIELIADDYYLNNELHSSSVNEKESLINYTIEHYLYDKGLFKYTYKLVDESGAEVKIEDLEKRIELNNNTNKFNI